MALTNVQPVLYRRGTRISPQRLDFNRHPRSLTGTVVATAVEATVVVVAGAVLDGIVSAQAQPAGVSIIAAGATPPVRLLSPTPMLLRRAGRSIAVIDEAVYKNVVVGTKEGTAAAIALPSTVSITANRIILGTVVAQADPSTASALSAGFVGSVGAASGPSTVSGTLTSVTNLTVSAQAQPAIVNATAVRTIVSTVAVQAQSSSASATANIAGIYTSIVSAQAQPSTVVALGSRGYQATIAAQAQSAFTTGTMILDVPNLPILYSVPTMLSRDWRRVLVDFHRYLQQGAEPITWAVVFGSLPPGLEIDSQTGIVEGKPTTIGYWDLRVQATNITGVAITDQFRWVISDVIPRDGIALNQNVVAIRGQ